MKKFERSRTFVLDCSQSIRIPINTVGEMKTTSVM